jgi:hypothetical protein
MPPNAVRGSWTSIPIRRGGRKHTELPKKPKKPKKTPQVLRMGYSLDLNLFAKKQTNPPKPHPDDSN